MMIKKILFTVLIIIGLTRCSNKTPEIKLGNLFEDHMVLQQQTHTPIWGECTPGVIVKVEPSWGESMKIRTDKKGKWMVDLKTPEFGGPYTITIKARKSIVIIEDVLIGEVWLCSGQSNMEMPLRGWPPNDTIDNSDLEINQANFPNLRMFTVERSLSFTELDSCSGSWQICSPDVAGDFSATAYFFGRQLHNQLDVPVGLIHSSWGGTPAESWTPPEYLKEIENYEDIEEKLITSNENIEHFNQWLSKLEQVDMRKLSQDGSFVNFTLDDIEYSKTEFDDSKWNTMKLPNRWESQDLSAFDGIVWFRKEFEVPDNVYPEGFSLYLGPVDDMDVTYINGEKIGGIEEGGHWNAEREYEIPESVIKTGKNIIAVRVIDTRGGGGIYGRKNIAIKKGTKEIVNLSGEWKYLPIAFFLNNDIYKFGRGEFSYVNAPSVGLSFSSKTPTLLYNAMIAPLVPYTIKGVIWYQGEANVGRGKQYRELFPQMIKSWRHVWHNECFPFYYVQIAPYNYGEETPSPTAELREAQMLTLKEKNVGMVVTTDIGNPINIHPGNKQEVGRRLALLALTNDYGMEDIVSSGPVYKSVKFSEGNAIISFTNIGGGLICKGEKISDFEIAGSDKHYYNAVAEIVEDKVVVSSDSVKNPEYVRFGWRDIAEPYLFNKEGFPVSAFRTSDADQ